MGWLENQGRIFPDCVQNLQRRQVLCQMCSQEPVFKLYLFKVEKDVLLEHKGGSDLCSRGVLGHW